MSLLEVKNLTFEYGTGKFRNLALDDVSFSLEKGEILSIIGHTGSGKSTLVQTLNGLLKPKSGTVCLDGENIFSSTELLKKARFRVGLVFQYPEYQLFEESVFKDISFGPKNIGLDNEEIGRRVFEASSFVGLRSELLGKSPFELSGGEKRRTAIAGILAMEPEILILDEPTAGLDPGGGRNLIENLIKLRDKNGTTIIIVSHSMENTAKISDKIMVMNAGKCEMFGTPKEIFSQEERLSELSLGIPQITRIMKSLKQRGCAVRDDILTVNEAFVELISLLSRRENL